MLYVKCVCVLSRDLSPVVVIINGFGICYMLNVFVCGPVISSQW